MEANQTLLNAKNLGPYCSTSRAQANEAIHGGAHDLKLSRTRTEALLYCFASAFVPISDENRDGGRAFPNSLESQLRFLVPARIALRGGERAGAVAICTCPCKKRAIPGTCLAS